MFFSRKSPSIIPNLAPISPVVHWLPSRSTELSLGRLRLGGILGLSPQLVLVHSEGQEPLLPLLGKSAVRMGCPSWHLGGAVRGRGSELLPLAPALNSLVSPAPPQRPRTWATSSAKYGYIYPPAGPQEPHSEARQQPLSISGELGLDLGCWWAEL